MYLSKTYRTGKLENIVYSKTFCNNAEILLISMKCDMYARLGITFISFRLFQDVKQCTICDMKLTKWIASKLLLLFGVSLMEHAVINQRYDGLKHSMTM